MPQPVAGVIEASITPDNADPDVRCYDDQEGDMLYPDTELAFYAAKGQPVPEEAEFTIADVMDTMIQ